ncbi:MAG: sigma-70 family RNA polymerase sigma factor [bacterium]
MRESETDIFSGNAPAGQGMPGVEEVADFDSFERLVRQYQPYAFSLAMRFLCDESEASDVVQDAFIRVWKHLDRYDRGKKFSTWLYSIVTNLCLDRFRSLKRRRFLFISREQYPELEELPDKRDWETIRTYEELAALINKLAGCLSKKQRLVFTLRDLQDLTIEEVVEITGMSIGSVKMNLHFARKALRDLLARRYGITRIDL